MGVCFIGERGKFGDFICALYITLLRQFIRCWLNHNPPSTVYYAHLDFPPTAQYTSPPESGYLVNLSGERLAEHKGLWYYTIGQRARVANQLKPMFVAKKGVGEKGTDILVVPGS